MNPGVSVRSKSLVNACLTKKSDHTDTSDNVFCGARRTYAASALSKTSDKRKSKLLDEVNETFSMHHSEAIPVTNELTFESPELVELSNEESGEKYVELPRFSPLTPLSVSKSFASMSDNNLCFEVNPGNTFNKLPDPEEKSHAAAIVTNIEALPFSPIPRLKLSALHAQVFDKSAPGDGTVTNCEQLPHETSAVSSIEAPPFSPLTPRPPCLSKQRTVSDPATPISPLPRLVSPLPQMSPETSKIFNILVKSAGIDNDTDSDTSNYNIKNSHPPVTPPYLDDDDSVQDPDYMCNDDISPSSSDNSSEKSISLLTTVAEIHQIDETAYGSRSEPVNDKEFRPILPHGNNDARSVAVSLTEEPIQQFETTGTDDDSSGRPKKGRKRQYGGFTREERKMRKYSNLPYVNWNKKEVQPKQFLDFNCNCQKKCQERIPVDKRLIEFTKFYGLGTYDAQNMFLSACVKEHPVKREYVSKNTGTHSKKKVFTREYYLQGKQICKQMFEKTLQTTSKRLNTSLFKMRSENCITDRRGIHGGMNKIPSDSEMLLINVIKKLPTYVSHYRRANNNNAKFLRPDMTFQKIYNIYCDESKTAGKKEISFSKAKQVFMIKFNLRTKPLKKDTCNKCDYFQSQITHATSQEDQVRIKQNHDAHLEKANSLRNRLKSDMKLAKEDPSTETLTFDLQKTLPLPRIPTNLVFYKRQMWVYNLGIHSGSDEQVHCNVWVEGEAGRGAQEVGSCLIKYALEKLDENMTYLIFWSDSCGGQNRNIKLTLMLKALLNDHPTLQKISIRFLESGHSFLPNDTDFGRIECALKHQQRIYTPEDYMQIMKSCKNKKPMKVHRMIKEYFLSSLKLQKSITNRKKAVDGSKISWLNTKEVMLKKNDKYSIFMRTNLDEGFVEVNLKKGTRNNIQTPLTIGLMELLWPNGKAIPEPKLKDLKSLMHLIPKDAQQFYTTVTGDGNIEDDIDGFSGIPDFDIEFDDFDANIAN